MDRNEKPHSPLPTAGSVVDPAAEAAHRHLSWTPDEEGNSDASLTVEKVEFDKENFVSYTGFPDGTFEVSVTLGKGQTVAVQQERGVGETSGSIRETMLKAYEKADRALIVIGWDLPEDVIEDEDDK